MRQHVPAYTTQTLSNDTFAKTLAHTQTHARAHTRTHKGTHLLAIVDTGHLE